MNLDAAIRVAVHGAAGELQMEMNEISVAHVTEADQRRAVRRALQMQLGPIVLPEGAKRFELTDWGGRLMGPDVVIVHTDRPGHLGFAECKWCREDNIYETLWDLLKLAGGLRRTHADHAYLIVGAPAEPWGGGGVGADLIADGAWQTRELFERYRLGWQWLLKKAKARPNQLPAAIETRLLAAVPVHLADAPAWELRVVSVSAPGTTWVRCEDGWPVADGAQIERRADPSDQRDRRQAAPPELVSRIMAQARQQGLPRRFRDGTSKHPNACYRATRTIEQRPLASWASGRSSNGAGAPRHTTRAHAVELYRRALLSRANAEDLGLHNGMSYLGGEGYRDPRGARDETGRGLRERVRRRLPPSWVCARRREVATDGVRISGKRSAGLGQPYGSRDAQP